MRWRPAVLAVCGVMAAGVACSDGSGSTDEASSEAPETVPAVTPAPRLTVYPVVDVAPDQVHRVAVEAPGRAVALVRSAAATWLPEPGTAPIAASLMAESEHEILPLQAYRRLDADPARPDFGLAVPLLVARIADAAGAEHVVAVGGATFSGAGYYARRSGDDSHVYVLVRRSVDDLRSLLAGERVNSPRSAIENEIARESARDVDPEEVSNPWLQQVLEERGK